MKMVVDVEGFSSSNFMINSLNPLFRRINTQQ